jgi:hypothetical protein
MQNIPILIQTEAKALGVSASVPRLLTILF